MKKKRKSATSSRRKQLKRSKKSQRYIKGNFAASRHASTFRKKKGYKRKLPKLRGSGPNGIPVIEGRVYGTKGDPLDFQISVKVKVPPGRTISAKVITEAIRYRIEKGRNPRGFVLKIVRWRNPNRRDTSPFWRTPTDAETVANTAEMLGARAERISAQSAAWVTLRQALAALRVSNLSLG
jgi:hypothetical protein